MKAIHKYFLGFICLNILLLVFNISPLYSSKTIANIFFGLYASTATVLIFEIFSQWKMRKNYKYLEGNNWKEFYSPDLEFEPTYDFSMETGSVTIEYLDENILSIKLIETKGNKIWYGNITMNKDNIKTGRVSWKYEPENAKHWFGLKELIVTEDDTWDYIYLMSVNFGLKQIINDKMVIPIFGNAVLRRKKLK